MSRFPDQQASSLTDRLRARFGRRAAGVFLTILLEGMLALLVLSIAQPIFREERDEVTVATFDTRAVPEAETERAPHESPETDEAPRQREEAQPAPRPPAPLPPSPVETTETPLIAIAPNRMAAADIANLPNRSPAPAQRSMIGPTGGAAGTGDTPRVGTTPGGEPMYAASWYREPTPEELRGYLSTADGPGWALIACRTVPNYRVEDCAPLDEYPRGSRMLRAVLAAAWQFRVRPPFIGGQPQVGEWVRIRIEYDLRRR